MSEETPESEFRLRPMNCELNQLSMPDGSAMLMQGNTAVVAGIYGPIEAKPQKMIYDKASVEVSYSPIKGPAKVDDRMTEMYIKETCEAAIIVTFHPATAICINVQELEDSGGILACTINAACLALINAGIPMKFTIAAVNCMIQEGTENIILDPDTTQLQEARAEFTFAFDSMKKDVICCNTVGCFTETEFLEAMEKCKQVKDLRYLTNHPCRFGLFAIRHDWMTGRIKVACNSPLDAKDIVINVTSVQKSVPFPQISYPMVEVEVTQNL